MINFWATWCGPCRQEMPLLDSIYKQYKDKDFTLLGVNVEPDPKLATDWLKKTPVSFPVLYDVKSDVSKLYKVAGMPTHGVRRQEGQRSRHAPRLQAG